MPKSSRPQPNGNHWDYLTSAAQVRPAPSGDCGQLLAVPPDPDPATLAADNPAHNRDTIPWQRFVTGANVSCRRQPGGRFRGPGRRSNHFLFGCVCVTHPSLVALGPGIGASVAGWVTQRRFTGWSGPYQDQTET